MDKVGKLEKSWCYADREWLQMHSIIINEHSNGGKCIGIR